MDLCICDLCLEPFDWDNKRPKCLPCGHTFCLGCMRMLPKTCSVCKKRFKPNPDLLPDNYKLTEVFTQRDIENQSVEEKVKTVEALVQTDESLEVVPKESKVTPAETKAALEDLKVPSLLFWCLDCDRSANIHCIDNHTVQNLKGLRTTRGAKWCSCARRGNPSDT